MPNKTYATEYITMQDDVKSLEQIEYAQKWLEKWAKCKFHFVLLVNGRVDSNIYG